MSRSTFIWAFFVLLSVSAFAQTQNDNILLINGKTIEAKIDTLDSLNMYYVFTTKSGKEKHRSIEILQVFSVTDAANKETVYYKKDDLNGFEFTEAEMRLFIKGSQDARAVHKSNWVYYVVGPVSAAGTYFIARKSIAAVAVPPATMILSMIPPYKVKKDKLTVTEDMKSDPYLAGYQSAAKSRRVVKATFAAIGGAAAAIIIYGAQQ